MPSLRQGRTPCPSGSSGPRFPSCGCISLPPSPLPLHLNMLAPFPLPLWSLPPHQELSHSADIILTWFKTQLAGKGTFIVPSGDELRHPRTEALKGMHSEDTYKTFLLPPGEPPGPSLHQDPDPYNHCVLSHSPGDDGYR